MASGDLEFSIEGSRVFYCCRQQLAKSLHAMKKASRRSSGNRDKGSCDAKVITFGTERRSGGVNSEADRVRRYRVTICNFANGISYGRSKNLREVCSNAVGDWVSVLGDCDRGERVDTEELRSVELDGRRERDDALLKGRGCGGWRGARLLGAGRQQDQCEKTDFLRHL